MRWHMIRKTFPTKEKFVGLGHTFVRHLCDLLVIGSVRKLGSKLFSIPNNMVLHAKMLKYGTISFYKACVKLNHMFFNVFTDNTDAFLLRNLK